MAGYLPEDPSLGLLRCLFLLDMGITQETRPGRFQSGGMFNLQKFFNVASQAGIYPIARPGPYTNAEVLGGGLSV